MMLVGLTGGIATGKSTVAHLFEAEGVDCIDADHLVRQLCQKDSPVYHKLLEHFGPDVKFIDGELDRKKIAGIIFSNPEEKRWVEALLHPLVLAEMQQRIAGCRSPYVLLIIPLLFETGPYPFLNRTLLIDLPEESQLARLMQRDGLNLEEATNRIKQQMPRAEKLKRADDVLSNAGNKTELQEKVRQLHERYLILANSRHDT